MEQKGSLCCSSFDDSMIGMTGPLLSYSICLVWPPSGASHWHIQHFLKEPRKLSSTSFSLHRCTPLLNHEHSSHYSGLSSQTVPFSFQPLPHAHCSFPPWFSWGSCISIIACAIHQPTHTISFAPSVSLLATLPKGHSYPLPFWNVFFVNSATTLSLLFFWQNSAENWNICLAEIIGAQK